MLNDKQDKEVPEEIVVEHMPLVESIASHIISSGNVPPVIGFEDLVSWGVEGLIKAYRNYKPDKGSQFNTYAYYRIRGEMLDKIRTEWQYRNPTEYASYRKKLQDRIADLIEDYSENGDDVVPERAVRDLLASSGMSYLISMDNIEITSNKKGLSNPEEEYIDAEIEEETESVIEQEIKGLEEHERKIVELFYKKGYKQKEIADTLKLFKEQSLSDPYENIGKVEKTSETTGRRGRYRSMRLMSKIIIGVMISTAVLGNGLFAQGVSERYEGMETMLFDETTEKIRQSVFDSSRAHAIYSYNVANFSTPGFTPILLEKDRIFYESIIPEDRNNSDVMLEYFMSQMTVNRSKHSALTKLFSTKLAIMRQVATLGKR